jgi:preprotein translocase subunit SecA
VETHNFEIRKHLLEYDDVMNKQREIIYGMRRQILDGESQQETIEEWTEDTIGATLDTYAAHEAHPEDWDLPALAEALFRQFDVRITPAHFSEIASREGLEELVTAEVKKRRDEREQELGSELMRALERHVMLMVIDGQWKDHLLSVDHLKEGIGLRGYGQRDPLTEYKREAFDLFQAMVDRVKASVVERLFKVQVERESQVEMPTLTAMRDVHESRGDGPQAAGPRAAVPSPRTPMGDKVGRNDPCPCGSGKKYKKCHYLQSK